MHPRVAYALNELGNVALLQGKLDDADLSRALNIFRSLYGPDHYRISIAQSDLAGVYVARKEYVRAEQLSGRRCSGIPRRFPPLT
jgi:hypothetical protein